MKTIQGITRWSTAGAHPPVPIYQYLQEMLKEAIQPLISGEPRELMVGIQKLALQNQQISHLDILGLNLCEEEVKLLIESLDELQKQVSLKSEQITCKCKNLPGDYGEILALITFEEKSGKGTIQPSWDKIFNHLENFAGNEELPSVSLLAREKATPFMLLISTILSLRTRDDVTLKSSRQLFQKAETPQEMLNLSQEEIEDLIFPVGFYKKKAATIQEICQSLLKDHKGQVPKSKEALLALPGVGLKTANLVLSLGFNINAICVDTHVHRIANRMGWVKTTNADQTEQALTEILPEKYWIRINELLVLFGQEICTPASPHCSTCTFNNLCPQVGVTHSR